MVRIATISNRRRVLGTAGLLAGAIILASCGRPTPAASGHAVAATPGTPSPREGAAMAYDPATQSVVIFGGDRGAPLLMTPGTGTGRAGVSFFPGYRRHHAPTR